MLILLLVISLLMIGYGIKVFNKNYYNLGGFISVVGAIIFTVALYCIAVNLITFANGRIIDSHIALYAEENAQIEAQVESVIMQYMDYESSTFANLKPDELIFAVTAYPELKTNELVQQQINLYISNNKRVRVLKEEKLRVEVAKWWLWFGGNVNQKE